MVDSNGLKVLLVDDDVNLVKTAGIFLKDEGYQVLEAFNGEQGLEIATRDLPDVIVLDIEMMPGISGPEVCHKLREQPQTAGIPIIFLTAKVDLDAMEATIDQDAQGYLLKPMSGYDLLDKIDEVLSEETG
ncbi:MAG TPA: response regulator [Candidatus Anoxymicrobiaceae bacterium]